MYLESDDNRRIFIGISACLVGHEVRYDGGHKLDTALRNAMGEFFHLEPICPEFELGLGVPRETLRLVQPEGTATLPRMIATESGTDHSEAMRHHCRKRVQLLLERGLSGFIAKANSPSCGARDVTLFATDGANLGRQGRGLFAEVLMDRAPGLPVEEESRLGDARSRRMFIDRVTQYAKQRIAQR